MTNLTCTTNHIGFQQYTVDHGVAGNQEDYVCPGCEGKYTNEGGGVLCKPCADTNVATSYVLLATYPGTNPPRDPIVIAQGDQTATDEENVAKLQLLARRLLDENIIRTAQVFKGYGEVMVQREQG